MVTPMSASSITLKLGQVTNGSGTKLLAPVGPSAPVNGSANPTENPSGITVTGLVGEMRSLAKVGKLGEFNRLSMG